MFNEVDEKHIIVTVCRLSQQLHETRKLTKNNEKLRFLSQQIISIIFIPTKRMRSKNMLFLTPMLESNAPYSNLFKNRG